MSTRSNIRFSGWALGMVSLLAFAMTGCQDDLIPDDPYLDTEETVLTFGVNGGAQTFSFHTDRDWFLEKIGTQDWFDISATEGPAGRASVVITVEPSSEDANARKGQIQLRASARGALITVIQTGIPIVTTGTVIAKDESRALVSSHWIYGADIELQERGIAYRKAGAEALTHQADQAEEPTQGDYDMLLEGLSPETDYEFKGYVLTGEGNYYYGEQKAFTTDKVSTLIAVEQLGELANPVGEYVKIEVVVLTDTINRNTGLSASRMFVADKGQSSKPGNGIVIDFSDGTPIPYNAGDVLEIKIHDAVLGTLNEIRTLQLHPIKVVRTGTAQVSPVKIDYAQLDQYEAMYVEIAPTQITNSYLDAQKYPNWNGSDHPNPNTSYTMEVQGSENTYLLDISSSAAFADDPVLTGSGSVRGIVSRDNNKNLLVIPTGPSDLAALTAPRFQTSLVLKFTNVKFNGELVAEKEVAGTTRITLSYQNAEEGEVIPGPVSIEMTGDAAQGLTIAPQSNIALVPGTKINTLEFYMQGTPATTGSVTFTVVGLEAYGLVGDAAVTRTTVASGIPEGNFTAVWKPNSSTGDGAKTPLALSSNTQPDIQVSSIVGTGFTGSNSGNWNSTYWGGEGFESNSTANPTTYAEFTVATGTKTLSIYSVTASLRGNNTGFTCTWQYKIGSGNFVDFTSMVNKGNSATVSQDLTSVAGLQQIGPGTTITFRLIPVGVGRWAINGSGSNPGLVLGGNAE